MVSSRRRLIRVGFAVAVIIVVVAAGSVALSGAPSFRGPTGAPNSSAGLGQGGPATLPPGCQQYGTPTSLLIPDYNPSTSVAVGAHVNVTLEFEVKSATVSVIGLNVYTPTVFVTMPIVGGGNFPVTFNNHTFTMTGPQWTLFSYNKLVTSSFTFDSSKNATLTTQKLATMVDTPYGTLKLEWRWSWNVTAPGGSYVQGPWTVPTYTQKHDLWLPSIFEPAPYVDLISESPANDLIGSNYTMYLGGDVAGRAFYIEFENQTGVVWAQTWVYDTSTTNATLETNITLLGAQGYLPPGLYLVHIHDSCLAMLYSKRVTLTYPSIATIQIVTTPSTCGGVKLNGTIYRNGQGATVVPSQNPVSFSFAACKGYTISNDSREGAIDIVGSRLMVVSANGTLIANYRQTSPLITVTPGQGPVGATVTVSGTGFSVSSTVGLVFDGVTITSCASGSLTTSGTGTFSCTFTVPGGTSGTSVNATDGSGQYATSTFTVTTPKITVTPGQGPVGATVTVSGTGFSVSSTVGLVFDGVTITSCASGSLTTSGTGTFSCTFTVPGGTSGTSVNATDGSGQYATSTFTVTTPKITVTPGQGPVGATVTVSGTGFSVSSTVGLVFDGVTITSCASGSLTTGKGGGFSCTFTVPSGTSGTSVNATDVSGQYATSTFTVTTPKITVTPGQGPVGATVTVSGTGFSVSSTVGLVFDGVTITSCASGSLTTGKGGGFSCTFTVPSGTSGTSVNATDVSGQFASGKFTVE